MTMTSTTETTDEYQAEEKVDVCLRGVTTE